LKRPYLAAFEAPRDNNGYTALTLAATKGHSEVVRLLIEKGANLNTTTSCGRTPLFYAIENGHLKTVRLLVDMNMSVSIGRRTLKTITAKYFLAGGLFQP
jgi:ankyrin repeat protein